MAREVVRSRANHARCNALEKRGVEGDASMRRWLPLLAAGLSTFKPLGHCGSRAGTRRRIQMLAIRIFLSVMFVTRKFETHSVGVGIQQSPSGGLVAYL